MVVHADPGARQLAATCSVDVRRLTGHPPDSLDFLLGSGYRVKSLRTPDGLPVPLERILDGAPVPQLHPGRRADRYDWAFIRVPSYLVSPGQRETFIFEYEGEGTLGMLGTTMFQMHDTPARWYPLRYDDPGTARCTVVTPDSMVAVFGGRRIGERQVGERSVAREFQTDFALNYFPLLVGRWETARRHHSAVELTFHHSSRADAERVLATVDQYLMNLTCPEMLGGYPYSQLVLVEYPPEQAGLNVAMPGGVIGWGGARGEALVHEISHLWWGAGVFSEHAAGDLFMNEAFATYTAAMFTELALGKDRMTAGFVNRQVRNHVGLLWERSLVDCVELNYGKGAYAVHLLRRVLGDEAFRDAIHDYLQSNIGSVANLPDLMDAFERRYGHDLDWFVEQWVRRRGSLPDPRLQYRIDHADDGGSAVAVTVTQEGDLYDLPLLLKFEGRSGPGGQATHSTLEWVRDKHEDFAYHFTDVIDHVSMNEDGWILTQDRLDWLPTYYDRPQRRSLVSRALPAILLLVGVATGYVVRRRRRRSGGGSREVQN